MSDLLVEIREGRVDLALRRDPPAIAWPSREPLEWERFSFPLRCLDEVKAIADECANLSEEDTRALIGSLRRAILWN
jgi:hypothetical protein